MAAARVASATFAVALVAGCVGARPEPTGVAQVFEPPQQLRERPGAFAVFAASPDEVRHHINYEVSTPIRGAEEGAGYGMRSIGQVAQIGQIVHPLATLALISGAAIVGAVMAHDADR